MTPPGGEPSRYESIARALATAVAHGRLAEGERFSCRKMAGRYKVSAETVRRAASLLEEEGVVRLEAGSGAKVISRLRAQEFMQVLQARTTVDHLQGELHDLMEQRRRLDEAIEKVTLNLLQYVFREVRGKGVS